MRDTKYFILNYLETYGNALMDCRRDILNGYSTSSPMSEGFLNKVFLENVKKEELYFHFMCSFDAVIKVNEEMSKLAYQGSNLQNFINTIALILQIQLLFSSAITSHRNSTNLVYQRSFYRWLRERHYSLPI
uniref:Uncharacterized protein n=1 Tax=Caenorhabditis tropicalis TaxID=1561998 RepID=A0A1I7UHY9_9PELO